jgi:tetratricopeptide (TPR) repeat protein
MEMPLLPPPTETEKPDTAPMQSGAQNTGFPTGHAAGMVFAYPVLAAQQAGLLRGAAPGQAGSLIAPAVAASSAPSTARAEYERGLAHAARGEMALAITALRRATTLDPAMSLAWRAQGDLLRWSGDAGGADAAYGSYIRAAANDAGLLPVRHAMATQQHELAARLLRARLGGAPHDIVAMKLLADVCVAQQDFAEAERLLDAALAVAPSYFEAREAYGRLLFGVGKVSQAVPQLDWLLARDATNPDYRNVMATALTIVGDFERAIGFYEEFIQQAPTQPALWLRYGNALKHAGRRAESVRAYRTCLDLAPTKGEAYFCLANLKTETLRDADIAAMRGHLAGGALGVVDRFHMHFALAHALEQAGDYAGSFAQYDAANRLWRSQIEYDADGTTAQMRRTQALFTPAFLADRRGVGCADAAPIFIVGLPRSGTTLVEQILASHSAIEGTIEMPEIATIARELGNTPDDPAQSPYPACLASLAADEFAALGAGYMRRSPVYRKTDKPFFIDKMPVNWPHVGLIHLMLPNAKIIDVRRAPIAGCFAAYKQYFAAGMKFSYDFGELGRYYNDYAALMEHFDTVLPGRIHHIQYETLVQDTEAEVRRLLAYCGVAFEPACLRFWENRRAVSTASAEQVRQPIFRDGLDQWRRFEPFLAPLKAALEMNN